MTAVCAGGTSSPRSGYDRVLTIAPNVIAALFQNASVRQAVAVAGFVGWISFDLHEFCTVDPPNPDPITSDDIAAVLGGVNPFAYAAAVQKFRDWIGKLLWPTVCQCDNGTVPGAPTPPTWPTDAPLINPPAVAPPYPQGTPCASFQYTWELTAPAGATPSVDPIVEIPPDVTNVTLTATMSRPMVSGETGWQVNLNTFNSSGTFSGNVAHVEASGAGVSLTNSGAFGGTAVTFRALMSNHNVATPVTITLTVDMFCGAAGGGGSVPQPCPSDPITLAILQQLVAMVTLIQRQIAPFGVVDGTVHTGLTGAGSIAVQGLIGVRVEVTDFGQLVGEVAGDPNVLARAGWINWGNADGVTTREAITAGQMLSFPPVAGAFTEVHYSLPIGMEVSITEIEREP